MFGLGNAMCAWFSLRAAFKQMEAEERRLEIEAERRRLEAIGIRDSRKVITAEYERIE